MAWRTGFVLFASEIGVYRAIGIVCADAGGVGDGVPCGDGVNRERAKESGRERVVMVEGRCLGQG